MVDAGHRYEIREKGGSIRRVFIVEVITHLGEGTQVPGVAGWATTPRVRLDDHGRVRNQDGTLATRLESVVLVPAPSEADPAR